MSAGCKLPFLVSIGLTVVALLFLVGCPSRPVVPSPSSVQRRVPGQVPPPGPGLLHEGQPYDVQPGDSLLTVLVFRGGALAKAGHNHVIASHTLHGTFYVPAADPARASFEVSFAVAELTVDEQALRARENEADFPPDVSESAKDGTRKNMLGGSLLDVEHYPDIVLRSTNLRPAPGSAGEDWIADVQVTVRNQASTVTVPAHYERHTDEVVVSGEFPLRQTALGLTPFSAMLGALQVVDEMKVRYRIVARVAQKRPARAATRPEEPT